MSTSASAAEPAREDAADAATLHERWLVGNQAYLLAELGRVKRSLSIYLARLQAPADGDALQKLAAEERDFLREHESGLLVIRRSMPGPPALALLCETCELSPFERDVLLLCAGVELDVSFAAACSQVIGRPLPTFSLALTVLPDAHWSSLSPSGALRRARLIDLGSGDTLTSSPLRIEERVLHYLTGVPSRDERLQAVLRWVAPPASGPGARAGMSDDAEGAHSLPPSQRAAAQRVRELLRSPLLYDAEAGEDPDAQPLLWLCGADPMELRSVAAAACSELGLALYALRAADVPPGPSERAALLALWQREVHLGDVAMLLCCGDTDPQEVVRAAVAWLERVPGPVLITGREPTSAQGRPMICIDVPRPTRRERLQVLKAQLGEAGLPESALEQVAAQFRLGVSGLATAAAQVRASAIARQAAVRKQAPSRDPRSQSAALWSACRGQARLRLDELARRIEPRASFSDLILPDAQRRMLQEIIIHQRHQPTVYDRWGLGEGSGRGLGITSLFVGQSGTGKTLAAEVLARELELDLYRIDLSQVVSKYIGETEKNLRRVFDAAEQGGAVLLFDEADALFGKRSEVKDSHDRYANLEISYLLQRMEAYQGISVLTSNNRSALDSAFLRRIRFIIHFPFPDPQQRTELWRRSLGTSVPIADLAFEKLARLTVTGGQIRNIVLGAAFLAADEGRPVSMGHLLAAARSEYNKSERPLTEAEIGGWV
jgi:AAA+ superfamily predicted ATPase